MFLRALFFKCELFEKKFQNIFFLILVLLCFFPGYSNAQGTLKFRALTMADGLTSNLVTYLFQDSKGFIWIGTADGLNRYDGQSVQQFYLSDNDSLHSLSDNARTIAEDIDHNILISQKTGIAKFSWQTRKISLAYQNEFSKYGNMIPSLFVDNKKNIWVNEIVRIRKFDPHFHLLHTWNLRPYTQQYLNGPGFTNILGEDIKQDLWVKYYDTLLLVHAPTNTIDRTMSTQLRTHFGKFKSMDCIGVNGNSIWLIADDFTLLHTDANLNLINSFQLPHNIFPSYNQVIEQGNKIWLATVSDGIFLIDKPTGVIQHIKSDPKVSEALLSNNTSDIIKDGNENIWIGTTKGISKWSASSSSFHQVHYPTPKSGSNQSNINQIFPEGQTLFTFTTSGFILTNLKTNVSSFFNGNQEYYTRAIPLNGKWFVSGTTKSELWKFMGERIIYSPLPSPHPGILDSNNVVGYYKDSRNIIWMGLVNDAGIVSWNTSNNTFTCYSQKGKGDNYCPLRHFKYADEDDLGNIWMGYEKGGIALFDRKLNRFVSLPAFTNDSLNNIVVTGIINDRHGQFWIATNTGLICYNESAKDYTVFSRKSGLPSNNITGIVKDKAGNIWLGFEGALGCINTVSKGITLFTKSEGLPKAELENPYYDANSNTLFFTTDHDVIYFNPDEIQKIIPKLNPVITSFRVMGIEQPLYPGSRIALPYARNYISFNFSAPNLINASENEYECKLDGVDKGWIFLGSNHSTNYHQLQPGSYVFHIRARIRNGSWQSLSTPVSISILTPFWRTTWFFILCAVALLSIIFSFVYVRLRSKFEKQIMAQGIRNKISADLHDDIGSTLSSINILSELAKQKSPESRSLLETISTNTSLMQEKMSDIIWAINPKNDHFGNITQHMSQFAAEILEPKNIILSFNTDESLASHSLSMDKRKNLYLFFKEAVNNCAKHSEATHVNVSITSRDHQVHLQISDDGKGFESENQYSGNGMSTMKSRAKQLNGTLEINSGNGRGTVVNLIFKV